MWGGTSEQRSKRRVINSGSWKDRPEQDKDTFRDASGNNPTGYIFFHVARESLVDFASSSRSSLNDFRRGVTKSAAICSHVQRDAVLFFRTEQD